MVFELFETKGGAGLLAKIEAGYPWDAYNILLSALGAFYAKRKAALEEKRYEQHRIGRDSKKRWSLLVVYPDKTSGKVNITYLGDFPAHKLFRHWTEQRFLVYFEFKTDELSVKERDSFKKWV